MLCPYVVEVHDGKLSICYFIYISLPTAVLHPDGWTTVVAFSFYLELEVDERCRCKNAADEDDEEKYSDETEFEIFLCLRLEFCLVESRYSEHCSFFPEVLKDFYDDDEYEDECSVKERNRSVAPRCGVAEHAADHRSDVCDRIRAEEQ